MERGDGLSAFVFAPLMLLLGLVSDVEGALFDMKDWRCWERIWR